MLSLQSRSCLLCLPCGTGDHLYRMDYRDFVRKHKESGAAITIAALPCNEKDASAFGLMKIDSTGKVVEVGQSDACQDACSIAWKSTSKAVPCRVCLPAK